MAEKECSGSQHERWAGYEPDDQYLDKREIYHAMKLSHSMASIDPISKSCRHINSNTLTLYTLNARIIHNINHMISVLKVDQAPQLNTHSLAPVALRMAGANLRRTELEDSIQGRDGAVRLQTGGAG